MPQEQLEGVSHCSKMSREMGVLDWAQLTAEQVFNRWRAIGESGSLRTNVSLPDGTGTTVIVRGVESLGKEVPAQWRSTSPAPGTFVVNKRSGHVMVQCREGVVALSRLQAPAKKEQNARDFVNGYRLAKGGLFS